MNRDILFRGIAKATGKFIYGSYVQGAFNGTRQVQHAIQTPNCYPIEVEDKTVAQYTGLVYTGHSLTFGSNEPNEIKCFEGDICKVDGIGICKVVIDPFYGVSFYSNSDQYAVIDSIAEHDSITFLSNTPL